MTDAEFLALVQAKFPHNVRIGDVTGEKICREIVARL